MLSDKAKEIFRVKNIRTADLAEEQVTIGICSIAKKYQLTDRETEIMTMMGKGYSYKHIADILSISIRTVKTHAKHIYQKTGFHTKQQIIDAIEQNKE